MTEEADDTRADASLFCAEGYPVASLDGQLIATGKYYTRLEEIHLVIGHRVVLVRDAYNNPVLKKEMEGPGAMSNLTAGETALVNRLRGHEEALREKASLKQVEWCGPAKEVVLADICLGLRLLLERRS